MKKGKELVNAKEQDMLGYMEIKYKVLDLLIELSKANGFLSTKNIVDVRKELEKQHNKKLMLEELESDKNA